MQKIIRNIIKCNCCGDVIESVSEHDFKTCKCGRVCVDGGHEYLRRLFKKLEDFTELSVIEYNQEFKQALFNHAEPACPYCGKGRIICMEGKIEKPHCFQCTNNCGWHMNIDYNDSIVD